MKKNLVILFAAALIFQGGLTLAATSETANIFSSLKDAIVKDVQNTVATTATSAINSVKLANYKTQLESKKKELAELEASNTNAFIKFFKKISLERKISELEANISSLEKEMNTTSETATSDAK